LLRVPNSRFCGLIGLGGGYCFAILSSSQRLMGLEPNAAEVKLYGIMSPENIEKRLAMQNYNNIELIDSSKSH
jgi:hypothetical protein